MGLGLSQFPFLSPTAAYAGSLQLHPLDDCLEWHYPGRHRPGAPGCRYVACLCPARAAAAHLATAVAVVEPGSTGCGRFDCDHFLLAGLPFCGLARQTIVG